MTVKGRILLVEDTPEISLAVRAILRRERYQVYSVEDGETGLTLARKVRPDLVILDINLPGMDGLELLKTLRGEGRVPVILLTARKTEADRIVGLKLGADDYVVKPFSAGELAARVESVLRRARGAAPAAQPLASGGIVLEPGRHEVRAGGRAVVLAPKEFAILRVLLTAGGGVVAREALLEKVWGYAPDLAMSGRLVDQYVSRLRRKLGAEGKRVVTVPTLGYKLV